MSKKELRVSFAPGLETPEGQARLAREVEARDDIVYRGFDMLRDLVDQQIVSHEAIRRLYRLDGEEDPDTMAEELMDEITQIIRDRTLADHKVMAALAGRPE